MILTADVPDGQDGVAGEIEDVAAQRHDHLADLRQISVDVLVKCLGRACH